MKIGSLIGTLLVCIGLLWLPLVGFVFIGEFAVWPFALGILGCLGVGIYLLKTSGPTKEEILRKNEEEAEAMYNGRNETDSDNK